jgi:hypothetical protein
MILSTWDLCRPTPALVLTGRGSWPFEGREGGQKRDCRIEQPSSRHLIDILEGFFSPLPVRHERLALPQDQMKRGVDSLPTVAGRKSLDLQSEVLEILGFRPHGGFWSTTLIPDRVLHEVRVATGLMRKDGWGSGEGIL